jgi:hypothetical protein
VSGDEKPRASRVRPTGSFDLCADAVTQRVLVATAQTRAQSRFPAGPPRQKAPLVRTSRARKGGAAAGSERAWQSSSTSSNWGGVKNRVTPLQKRKQPES